MLGLPHGMAAIPPSPLGGGLGRTFITMCFSVTFHGAFANTAEMLQGSAQVGNRSSGRGGFPLPEKMRFVAGFAAGFVVVEFAAVSPLPSPAVFECPRGSRALSVVSPELLFASRGSSAASSDDLQHQPEPVPPRAHSSLTKAPRSLHRCSARPPVRGWSWVAFSPADLQ